MSDEKCRERVVARVIFALNQLIQPRNTSVKVEVFTTAILDVVENEVPPPARRTADMDGVSLLKPWPHL